LLTVFSKTVDELKAKLEISGQEVIKVE